MSMKDLFPGYFKPTEAEFKKLWDEAMFSFDTSFLLNLYEYQRESTQVVLERMAKLKQRIYITHRVIEEYLRNRLATVKAQTAVFDAISKELQTFADRFQSTFPRHHSLPVDRYKKTIRESFDSLQADISSVKTEHEKITVDDPILSKLLDIIGDNHGKAASDTEFEGIIKTCKSREAKNLPPGDDPEDKKKPGDDKYGDVIIWLDLLNYAKEKKAPLIFVTGERKSNWWLKEPPCQCQISDHRTQTGIDYRDLETPRCAVLHLLN